MSINRINSNSRLSGAVTFGDLVFLSGQVPGDSLDVTGQTAEVLAKIDALLAEADSDKDHLLNATIYLNDIGRDFAAMNEVWSQWLSPGKSPTRTTLQAQLARPEVLVEITVIAARR
ncbi:RidA family protein [Pseudomonas sp. PS02303]|uniref:RidA family protein n=1 Tax=Pseudomonas sp. PS02303 TaxID=2991429 RepID=UPI00249BEA07|nr:RidA family protein [Pseudomonas sp. PS02303]